VKICIAHYANASNAVRNGTKAHVYEGSHSFTCYLHVYPRVKLAILSLLCKHSPDGVATWER